METQKSLDANIPAYIMESAEDIGALLVCFTKFGRGNIFS